MRCLSDLLIVKSHSPKLSSWLCHLPAVHNWVNHLTILNPCLFTFKMWINQIHGLLWRLNWIMYLRNIAQVLIGTYKMLCIISYSVTYSCIQTGLKTIIIIPSERLFYWPQIAQLVSGRIMIQKQVSHFTSYSLDLWDYSPCPKTG